LIFARPTHRAQEFLVGIHHEIIIEPHPHDPDEIRIGEPVEARLAAPQRRFRAPDLRQVDDVADLLVVGAGDARAAERDRNARAVFAHEFFLVLREFAVRRHAGDGAFVERQPFDGRERAPVDHAAFEFLARVADDREKRVVGLDHGAGIVRDDDADDVRVEQQAQTRVADRARPGVAGAAGEERVAHRAGHGNEAEGSPMAIPPVVVACQNDARGVVTIA
jgi:hypothetical protein